MAKKKKGGRRAALKGFAKGKFQSPVHSNGFKQDVLIDMHGGEKGLDTAAHPAAAASLAAAAGKSYFKYQGTTYKVQSGPRGYGATTDDRTGNVK
tara:strand:- start:448 stop:732 length:285 start_codon:yes stop_codon:yes gene_type:complete